MQVLFLSLAGVALLFAAVLFSTLMGAFAGWVVGGTFPETFRILVVDLLKLQPSVEPWQVGAILGFVGAFFRTTVTNKQNTDS